MNAVAMAALADRFVAALENSDSAALRDIYSPDAVIWHNYDDGEQPREENISMHAQFPTMFREFRFTQIQRHFFAGGYVQQHIVCGVKASGESFSVPDCMVVTVRGGRIARVDEYFDSAQDARPAESR